MLRSEQETVIQYDLEERVVHIFTRIPKDMQRLDNFCLEFPDEYQLVNDYGEHGKEYITKIKHITFKKPKQLSDETRKKLAERGKIIARKNFHTKKESID